MENILIRKVMLNDLDKIFEIESLGFPVAEAAPKNIIKERLEGFKNGFFVAEIGNEIVGFINSGGTNDEHLEDEFFETMNLHKDNGKYLAIFSIAVHPDHRKKGIAEKLMTHFIEEAKNNSREKIFLTCKDYLIHYYEKFGYINEGVSESVHGGAKWYDMYLKL